MLFKGMISAIENNLDLVEQGPKLDIFVYPDPILTTKAKEVTSFDPALEDLCKKMLHTMYHAPGIGLAGPQVGKSQRIFVLDVHYERKLIVHPNGDEHYEFQNLCPQIFINPKITNLKGKTTYQEGCLSVPGIYEDVVRFETCQVEYQDFHGETHSIHADGLLSICIQHENDHLNGIVFIERLSQLKKRFFKTKLLKEKKRLPL